MFCHAENIPSPSAETAWQRSGPGNEGEKEERERGREREKKKREKKDKNTAQTWVENLNNTRIGAPAHPLTHTHSLHRLLTPS